MMKLLKKHVEITYKHGEINTQIRLNPIESVAGIQVGRASGRGRCREEDDLTVLGFFLG